MVLGARLATEYPRGRALTRRSPDAYGATYHGATRHHGGDYRTKRIARLPVDWWSASRPTQAWRPRMLVKHRPQSRSQCQGLRLPEGPSFNEMTSNTGLRFGPEKESAQPDVLEAAADTEEFMRIRHTQRRFAIRAHLGSDFIEYARRRVDCPRCGVKVEHPLGRNGKQRSARRPTPSSWPAGDRRSEIEVSLHLQGYQWEEDRKRTVSNTACKTVSLSASVHRRRESPSDSTRRIIDP